MHTTTRLLGPDDAAATAALMARIDADHPTGFCLSADEVVEVMEHLPGSLVLGAEDDGSWSATRWSWAASRTTAGSG